MHLFFEAKNGEPTVRYRGILLHSSYNPSREALRFAEQTEPARCYLILGGGLGHLATAVAKKRPGALICTLHPSRELANAAAETPGTHGSPESRSDLAALLNAAFRREGAYGFEVLSWEPAAKAAPKWFKRQEFAVLSLAREWHDSLISTGYFGFRWLRNSVRNLAAQPADLKPFVLTRGLQPVLVAPGPTLDDTLPWIRRERSKLFLLCVSSGWSILRKHGLEPDLLLHTDGSYWATLHLHGAENRPSPPLATSIRAALPGALRRRAGLFLTDPSSPVDRALSSAITRPSLPLRGHGTVSGSALGLIASLMEAPPLLLGLDLAVKGLRSHARGHTFESLIHEKTSRITTLPTILRDRLGEAESLEPPWQQPRDLKVYAASLAAELADRRARCYRLTPSPVDLSCQSVSDHWSPEPPELRRAGGAEELRIEPGPRAPESVGGILRRWKELFRNLTLSAFAPPGEENELTELAEELSQMLALPELLRLRSSLDRENGSEEAFRSLKGSVEGRIDRLLRSANG